MKRLKIHVLYEYGVDSRPFGSSQLRLLRPLTHPAIAEKLDITFGRELFGFDDVPDLVFVDRLWRPDISKKLITSLAEETHRMRSRLIYWFDDNFLALENPSNTRLDPKEIFQAFLEVSDGLVVTTQNLKETFAAYRKKTCVLPNTLDERLIVPKYVQADKPGPKIVIGYMGTPTHDEDLRMIAPVFQTIQEKYPGKVQFQIIGAFDQRRLSQWEEMKGIPFTILQPAVGETEYPLFMTWFTAQAAWDIALAPLLDTDFNRAKSDIKFLDYSAAALPGVYSSGAPYAASVEDHKTGLLVDNDTGAWVAAIEELIENPSLRRDMIGSAAEYLYSKRTLQVFAPEWLKTIYEFS